LEFFVKIYVGNLSPDTTDAQLTELSKKFGTPSSAVVVKDKATGQPRGFGFVEFNNDDEARAAINGLNGKEVNGKTLKVNESRPKNAGASR
jgi:cold-inducible RNA-binding protein